MGVIKVIAQLNAGKYTILILSKEIPFNWKKTVKIDNEMYDTEIVYDIENSIGVIGKGDFVGKEVKFLV